MTEKTLGIEVQATIDDAQSKLQDLLSTLQNLPDTIASIIQLEFTGADILEETQATLEELNGTDATAEVNIDSGDTESELKGINSELDDLDGKTADTEVTLDNQASDEIETIASELGALDGTVASVDVIVGDGSGSGLGTTNGVKETNNSLQETSSIGEMVGEKLALIGATILGVNTIGSSFTIEKQLELANYHGGGTAKTLDQLREKVKGLTSGSVSGEDISESMAKMAEQGASANDILSLIGPSIDLVKTKQADASTVGQFAAQIMQRYGISSKEAADNLEYMNAAALHTSYTGDQWIAIMNKADKSSGALGLSFKDQTNVIGSLASSGKDYTQVMMAMRSGLNTFRKEVDPTNSKVTDAEKAIQSMGISFKDANGHVKSQKEILKETLDKLAEMPDGVEKTRLATEIFGDSVGQTFSTLKKGPSEFGEETEKAGDKSIKKTKEIKAANMDLFDYIKKATNWASSQLAGLPTAAKLAIEGILLYIGADAILGSLNKIKPTEFVTKLMDKLGLTKINSFVGDKLKEAGSTIKSFVDDVVNKIFKTGVKADENGLIKMIEVKPGQYEAEKSKLSNFVNDIKSRIKSLKDSNIFKMLFSDEKGTVNSSFMDDLAKNIENGLNKVKDAIKAPFSGEDADTLLKRQLMRLDEVFDDEAGRVTTSSDNLANSLRNGLNKIKGNLKIDFKLELPKLNIGASIDDAVNSLKTSITGKLPSVESVGAKLPEALGKGLTKGLKALTISMGAEIAGWGAGLAIQVIDSLANIRDVLADPFKYLGMGQQNLSPVGGFFSKDSMYAAVLPKEVRGILSPENILKLLVGESGYAKFSEALKKYVEDPMKKALGDTFKDPLSLFKPITDKFKNINIISLLMPGLGTANNKDNPVDKFINDLKTKIGGFVPWLQSLKFPNILDLIFGNNKKDGKGGDKANPLDTFVNDIKSKIGGLKAWILSNIPKVPAINWKPLSQGLQEIWTWITKKYNDLKNFIKNNTPKIPTLNWSNLSKGVRETVKWIQDKWNELKNFLKDLGPKMRDYGRKIMDGLVAGLKEKMGPFKDIMKYISDHFPKSPPKIGPLSEVTPQGMADFGYLLGSGLTDGLAGATNNLFGTMGGATGALYSAPTSAAAVTNNNDSGINIETVEVSVPESVKSTEEAYLYGQAAGSGFVDTLKNEVSSAGILYR